MDRVRVKKTDKAVSGALCFPGDKSLSHRAIIFGALAEGKSVFTNVLPGEDCVCTRRAFEAMGVSVVSPEPTTLEIAGRGLNALKAPQKELYLGNSGTSMRLLLGVLAGQPFQTTLTGDPSLSRRPMRRVTDYLRSMGAGIEGKDEGNYAPLTVRGGKLKGLSVTLEVSSAQVKSAILLAGLYAEGKTVVREPVKSRDHTERFLSFFGAKVSVDGLAVGVEGGQRLQARSFEIAGDISSAAFFMAIAALLPQARVQFKHVLWNPTRSGIVNVFQKMGVPLSVEKIYENGPEAAADFSIEARPLRAFEIKKEELPSLIDEVPILAVLATQAEGTSIIHDAEELRVKETDRIHSMVTMLGRMGADIRAEGNTLYIRGKSRLRGARVDSFKDHRTAMALFVAGLIAEGETVVEDLECINTSFPNFFGLVRQLGIDFRMEGEAG